MVNNSSIFRGNTIIIVNSLSVLTLFQSFFSEPSGASVPFIEKSLLLCSFLFCYVHNSFLLILQQLTNRLDGVSMDCVNRKTRFMNGGADETIESLDRQNVECPPYSFVAGFRLGRLGYSYKCCELNI